ncbi:hypothetical protein BST81_01675 [Leptolyngbya sp. 'hensonii']|uniref:WD40 repeat domain-containing protein n=1 Tax=Leptolyngbya sp. 'hensonii' TaxID=1922337 RepID=UPI000950142D|nr:WD40 repeat domain-containing protein [Leptolyngbya sp. 'hensonii']OLP20168.1 hypothetical protein BST81_01675 [Leptolyngbya sp. 'hensonii']
MSQTRTKPAIGILILIGIILILVCAYVLYQDGVASQIKARICLPLPHAAPVCYRSTHQLPSRHITAMAIHPHGSRLAIGLNQAIQLWDVQTMTAPRTFSGHLSRVTALAISPDEKILASASLDQTIRLWNLKTGHLQAILQAGRVTCLVFSPNGHLLAASSRYRIWPDGTLSQGGVQLWDVKDHRLRQTIGTDVYHTLAFSPQGQVLAAGSAKAHLWDLQSGHLRHILDSGEPTALQFSPDGRTLLTGSSRTKLWQVKTGQLSQSMNFGATDLTLNPNGQFVAAPLGGTIYFWQLSPRKLLGTLRGSWYSNVSVQFGWQGRALVAVGTDGLQLWQTTPGPVPASAN